MRGKKGLTIIEVCLSIIIIGIVSLALVQFHFIISRQSVRTRDKAFALQKAMQMMEELRSMISTTQSGDITVLDDYDDGTAYNPILSTLDDVDSPDNPVSGNVRRGNGWKFLRKINVIHVPNDPLSRRVYVRVYLASQSNPSQGGELLAELISVLRTVRNEYYPSQVYDIYVIAIENVPGWWVHMSMIRPAFDSVLQDLKTRNPGLEFRTHWITSLSYGRDTFYKPYINYENQSDDQTINWVYYYPGKVEKDGEDFIYYGPEYFTAKINVDGTTENSDSYSCADQYNQGMRYPDEWNYYQNHSDLEPSLRILLERMVSNPDDFKNSLIVNLHGELLPLPPIRNYSDPAKDPANFPQYRVVTHPEKLEYSAGEDVVLRVYPFLTNYPNSIDSYPGDTTLSYVTVVIKDTAIPSANISVEKLVGNHLVSYAWQSAVLGADYNYSISGDSTVITLLDTPMRHPLNPGHGGLDSSYRLYGLEYIPCPVESASDFSIDLTNTGSTYDYRLIANFDEGVGGTAYDSSAYGNDLSLENGASWEVWPSSSAISLDGYDDYLQAPYDPSLNMASITIEFRLKLLSDPDCNSNNNWRWLISRNGWGVYHIILEEDARGLCFSVKKGGSLYRLWENAGKILVGEWYDFVCSYNSSTGEMRITRNGVVSNTKNIGSGALDSDSNNLRIGWPRYSSCPNGNGCPHAIIDNLRIYSVTSGEGPKNTARWKITISNLDNGCYTVETRIGNTTSSTYPNLSRTYVWVGVSAPYTEKYQYIGDPRHMPYKDVKLNHGYNWYFRNDNFSGYGGFTKVANGWDGGGGKLNIDIPRYFQLWRQALLNSESFFNNMTGFSFYYVGIGGEIGGDSSNGFPNGIKLNKYPWGGGASDTTNVCEIRSSGANECYKRIIKHRSGSWFSLYWIGELYPDDYYNTWISDGNLPASDFSRAHYDEFFGTYKPVKRTCYRGCASFFNGTSSGGTGPFMHEYRDSNDGTLTSVGTEVSETFNFPLLSQIDASRPFTLDYNGRFPPEWSDSVYSSQRTTLSIHEIYYDASWNSSNYDSSALVKLSLSGDNAFMVMNGIDKQKNFGTSQIARLSISCLLRGFLTMGEPTIDLVTQVPKVTIVEPKSTDEFNNPGVIYIEWQIEWKRWDGEKYTSNYPDDFSPSVDLIYGVMYSDDNGKTWKNCGDDTLTVAGYPTHTITDTYYNWNVSTLPRGSYIIRVEAHREDIKLHYSYHQIQIYLNNPS